MTKYQNLFSTILFLLVGMFLFTSCDKEELTDFQNDINETVDNITTGEDLTNGMRSGNSTDCFEIVFPIDLDVPGSGIVTINDYATLETTLENYYDANPDTEDDPLPIFPVEVILEDGTQESITNEDDLEELFEECFGDDWEDECDDEDDYEEDCFEINFPVTLIFSDGSTVLVNNEDEAEDAQDAFEDANPDLDDDYTVEFPIEVTLEDGSVQSIADEAAFEALEDTCD